MEKKIYVLTNGTEVNTWMEAIQSGEGFRVEYKDIPEKRPDLLPKQAARVKAVKAH